MKKFVAFVMAIAMVAAMFAVSASAEAGTVKIGVSGPLTGGAAVYGTCVARSAQIAVDEVNALGGLQFELNCQDDEHDAEKAVSAYNSLKDWKMQIFCGTVTTKPALAVGPEACDDRIFMLTPSASAVDVAYSGDNVFQICFADPMQGSVSADVISEKGLGTKIGVIYDSSDVYSTGILETFLDEADVAGLEVVCTESFTADTKADLSTQVTKCKEAGADLVFLPIYCAEASAILSYANQIGYAPVFFGVDGMDGILDVEGFDTSLAEGLYMLTPFAADSTDERTAAYVAKCRELYNETPNQFGADAYDAIWALYQACTEAGIDGSESNEEICDAMIAQFTSMTYDGITGQGMTWDEDGFVDKPGSIVVIKDGAYTAVE